jgi:hypothetical protein
MGELRSRKQQREQVVRSLRAEGKSWVEVAEALRQRYRFNARVALRYAHGWSQREAADEWNKRWPDELKSFKTFSYWEMWPSSTGHAPSFGNLSKLAELYSTSGMQARYRTCLPGRCHSMGHGSRASTAGQGRCTAHAVPRITGTY